MGTITMDDIQALIQLAARANLSQAEQIWLRVLIARVNEQAKQQQQGQESDGR